MKLQRIATQPGLARLESSDDITLLDFKYGVNPLDTVLGPDDYAGTVLLGLARSPYIDSTGVGWLIQCNARFQRAGGHLVLHSISPMINHCFRVLGMYDVLQIVDSEATALKLVADTLAVT
jgi:anti-anti-sigma factor